MEATTAMRAATLGGLYALVLWGHFALPDVMRFALFLGCVVGALVAGGALVERSAFVMATRRPAAPGVPCHDVAPEPIGAERDALHRLEAELYALEDQLRSGDARPHGNARIGGGGAPAHG